jgi:hypothetical protein
MVTAGRSAQINLCLRLWIDDILSFQNLELNFFNIFG